MAHCDIFTLLQERGALQHTCTLTSVEGAKALGRFLTSDICCDYCFIQISSWSTLFVYPPFACSWHVATWLPTRSSATPVRLLTEQYFQSMNFPFVSIALQIFGTEHPIVFPATRFANSWIPTNTSFGNPGIPCWHSIEPSVRVLNFKWHWGQTEEQFQAQQCWDCYKVLQGY